MTEQKFAGETSESQLHFLDYWRIIRIRKVVIFIIFFLTTASAAVYTFLKKDVYASTVRITVERETPDIADPISGNYVNNGYDPFWFAAQFDIIQSRSIIYPIIEREKLVQAWSTPELPYTPETVYQVLTKGRMKVRPYRNNNIIEISVEGENQEENTKLASAVANGYRESRLFQYRDLKMKGVERLQERMKEMSNNIARVQYDLSEMRRTNNIIEINESINVGGYSPTMHTAELQRLNQQRQQFEFESMEFNNLLTKVRQISREDLPNALPTLLPEPDHLLVQYMLDLSAAQQKLVLSAQDYNKEHPVYKALQANVDLLESKIDARVASVVETLQQRVDTAQAKLNEIMEKEKASEARENELTSKFSPYFEAKRDLERLRKIQEAFELKIEQETVAANYLSYSKAVTIIDPATSSLRPIRPIKSLNISIGAILGLMIGVGLAFFIEYLDTSVKTIDDVERVLQTPVLGVIPQKVGTLLFEGPDTPHAEAYRVLRTNVLFARKQKTDNTLTVVSAGVGEGKSTTLLNLATIFAQSGDRVLVVDSDLRRPSLHKLLKVSNSQGLTNCLQGQSTLEEMVVKTPLENLFFLPSGKLPSSSWSILGSTAMKELIQELKKRYDYVFFDSPPIIGVSDGSVLASEVDVCLQVVQYRRYPTPMTIRAKQTVQKIGGHLVGIVLNNINMSQDESYYYYSGYHQEYYGEKDAERSGGEYVKGSEKPGLKSKY